MQPGIFFLKDFSAGRPGDIACGLVAQLNAGHLPQPELARPFLNLRAAEQTPDLIEEKVAGILDGMDDVHPSVIAQAAEGLGIKISVVPRAELGKRFVNCPGFKRGNRHQRLEGRAGGVGLLNRAVSVGLAGVILI